MTKKILFLTVASCLSLYGIQNNDNEINIQTTQQNDSIVDASLKLSLSLVDLTNNMLESIVEINGQNSNTILQLSQDIGTMADRINIMADKIVQTQEIQSENFVTTEENMIQVQENMAQIISKLEENNNVKIEQVLSQIKQNMKKSQVQLGNTQNSFNTTYQKKAIKQVKESIEQSPTIQDLIGQLDSIKPQYKFMVMNAIKAKMVKGNSKNRAKEQINSIKNELISTLERSRENKQSNLQGTNSASLTRKISLDTAFSNGMSSRDDGDMFSSGLSGIVDGMTGSSSVGGAEGMGGSSSGGMGSM